MAVCLSSSSHRPISLPLFPSPSPFPLWMDKTAPLSELLWYWKVLVVHQGVNWLATTEPEGNKRNDTNFLNSTALMKFWKFSSNRVNLIKCHLKYSFIFSVCRKSVKGNGYTLPGDPTVQQHIASRAWKVYCPVSQQNRNSGWA